MIQQCGYKGFPRQEMHIFWMKKYIFSRTTAQNYKTTTKCNFLKLSLKKSVIHKHTTENHQQVKNPIQTILAM